MVAPKEHAESLTIVIPALDEEEAIASTIERCIAARKSIIDETTVERVEIVVVSDGSTDRTPEIARSYEGIHVIAYEKNKGYGAAIKLGFEVEETTLVGFLDADGTCDPAFFSVLVKLVIDGPSDVALGSRMHPNSKMPRVRWLGNTMYAYLLRYLADTAISDTASGMRVIRRNALPHLYPLPDGLHFTPAMTCKTLLDDRLVLSEAPMPYAERLGRSKLNVLRDGMRFFKIISEIALSYRPLKFFGVGAGLAFGLAFLYGLGPVWVYAQARHVPERFIYRLMTINTLAMVGLTLLTIGILADKIAGKLNRRPARHDFWERRVMPLFEPRLLLCAGPMLVACGVLLNLGTILDYVSTFSISYHWVYVSTGSLLVVCGFQLIAIAVLDLLIQRILLRCAFEPSDRS